MGCCQHGNRGGGFRVFSFFGMFFTAVIATVSIYLYNLFYIQPSQCDDEEADEEDNDHIDSRLEGDQVQQRRKSKKKPLVSKKLKKQAKEATGQLFELGTDLYHMILQRWDDFKEMSDKRRHIEREDEDED